jgi:hypothetical protein
MDAVQRTKARTGRGVDVRVCGVVETERPEDEERDGKLSLAEIRLGKAGCTSTLV